MTEPNLEDIIARLSDALECDPFEEQFAALVASWRERGEALKRAQHLIRNLGGQHDELLDQIDAALEGQP